MSRAAITGIGCVGPAGVGAGALQAALRAGRPLGEPARVPSLRGRSREMRLARLTPFDREAFLPARRLRRMGEASQIWVVCCLLARADAGLDGEAGKGGPAPEARGTFLGTGYGCIDTTWEYLQGMFRDGAGMASPFLFSESVANAPAGHSAIELDTRGASVTFTCGDASAAAAVEFGARAVREGRVRMAYCGGVELLSEPLLRVLSALGAPPFLGEGAVCLILEPLEAARARGARVYAELAPAGMSSDPLAGATQWSRDPERYEASMRRALEAALPEGGGPRRLFLHACGDAEADAAERRAAATVCPGAEATATASLLGGLGAAGGFSLASAALWTVRQEAGAAALVNASSWGGSLFSLALRAVRDRS